MKEETHAFGDDEGSPGLIRLHISSKNISSQTHVHTWIGMCINEDESAVWGEGF